MWRGCRFNCDSPCTDVVTLVTRGILPVAPGVLAKIIGAPDLLSGGRARLGIGAAWYEAEAVGLGLPLPPVAERFERLAETLEIWLRMWRDDEIPHAGRTRRPGGPRPCAGRAAARTAAHPRRVSDPARRGARRRALRTARGWCRPDPAGDLSH
ncbi:LLM class flavin-dependent oxidoreductase [Candidatus Frankia alpina]|uniref:LLM class flavin-dependent oxidoreductase n=1 Tax=Candidatus Frankia alpina TaxID=2699483 RepID=UPI0013D478CD|nr:LLM class flavin-dependent oxidoreductase [Candidatus Frankia alpina]